MLMGPFSVYDKENVEAAAQLTSRVACPGVRAPGPRHRGCRRRRAAGFPGLRRNLIIEAYSAA